MMAGFAMLILAFGALVMVLCTGFGDADDEERDDVTDPRGDTPDPLGGWSPEADAALRRLRGRGFGLR